MAFDLSKVCHDLLVWACLAAGHLENKIFKFYGILILHLSDYPHITPNLTHMAYIVSLTLHEVIFPVISLVS